MSNIDPTVRVAHRHVAADGTVLEHAHEGSAEEPHDCAHNGHHVVMDGRVQVHYCHECEARGNKPCPDFGTVRHAHMVDYDHQHRDPDTYAMSGPVVWSEIEDNPNIDLDSVELRAVTRAHYAKHLEDSAHPKPHGWAHEVAKAEATQ